MAGKKSPGVTLIVVLGVLTLLVLLATVFSTLTFTERRISRNYLDAVRAKHAAQTGVEVAVERLAQVIDKGWFDGGVLDRTWIFYGSQTDETQAPRSAPLEEAINPSFAFEREAVQNPYDAAAIPLTLKVKGREVGVSGFLPSGTYGGNADSYSLKVLDAQSMIHVNDGVKGGRAYSVSRNLERILNALGALPSVNVPQLGTRILDHRPPGGYRSKFELLRAVGFDAGRFDRIRDHVTATAWVDSGVCNPVPLSAAALGGYPIAYDRPKLANGTPVYRYGHNVNALGAPISAPLCFFDPAKASDPFHHAIWEIDSLSPQYVEMVERAPVNLNTAGREVLLALVSGLQGVFQMGRRRNTPSSLDYDWMVERYSYDAATPVSESNRAGSDVLAWLYSTIPYDAPGSTTAAANLTQTVVEEILACRAGAVSPAMGVSYKTLGFGGPFKSWAQFNRFVDRLVDERIILDSRPYYDYHDQLPHASSVQSRLASRAMGDVLKANFNPNLHLNELNPNRILHSMVDKTDLICNSTEGCFTPMGCFEIESLGRVVKPVDQVDALEASDNLLIAAQQISVAVRMYDAIRESSQGQFYAGEFGPRKTQPGTNNDAAVEVGPEPDNGPHPMLSQHEGYVCLSTLFGDNHWATPRPDNSHFHDHYVWDNGTTVFVRLKGNSYEWQFPIANVLNGTWVNSVNAILLPYIQTAITHYLAGERSNPDLPFGQSGASGIGNPPVSWTTSGGKPKGELHTTLAGNAATYPGAKPIPQGSQLFYDWIHSHFRLDHCAHHHVGGGTDSIPLGTQLNFPDRTEPFGGPYAAVDSGRAGKPDRYCLGRSFRMTPLVLAGSTTLLAEPPVVEEAALLDLRIDGAYCEHNSSFGFQAPDTYFNIKKGAISFWVKPNFTPEATGRTRLFADITRYAHKPFLDASGKRTNLFGLYHFPYHRFYPSTAAYSLYEEPYAPIGSTGWGQTVYPRPLSLATLWSYSPPTGDGGGSAYFTPTLNHKFHGPDEGPSHFVGPDGKLNHLRANEWTHVTIAWKMNYKYQKYWKEQKNKWVVIAIEGGPIELVTFINGRMLPGGCQVLVANPKAPTDFAEQRWMHDENTVRNSIRIGGQYSRPVLGISDLAHKYFADSTIDEFFYWNDDVIGVDMGAKIASYGRYHKPLDSDPDSGAFLSRDLPVAISLPRKLPDPSPVAPPAPATTEVGASVPAPQSPAIKALAVQWTELAEDYAPVAVIGTGVEVQARLRPVMYNYHPMFTLGRPPLPMSPAALADVNGFVRETVADLYVAVDGVFYGPYRNEPWSPIRMAHVTGVFATGPDVATRPPTVNTSLRYKTKFRLGLATAQQALNAILLTTPYVDDVTLFYTRGEVEYLNWTVNP
jgi:hypothetical protein